METPEPGPPGVHEGRPRPAVAAAPPVGSRVVVRHRLLAPDPRTGATLTDVVGDLVHADADTLVVRSRRGEVAVPRAAVVALKEVPPAPSRRGAPHLALAVADLQRVMVGAWPPVESEHLGGWLLRASGGFTQRGNSVLTVGDPGLPLAEAVDVAEAWYRARALTPALTVLGPRGFALAEDPLAALLLERGYLPRVVTSTLTAATEAVLASTAAATPPVGVGTSSRLDDAWFAAYARYRDAPTDAARAVLTGSSDQVFASVEWGEEVVAVGRLGVASAWGGVAAMWVAPERRRQGLATAVLDALARSAADRGLRSLHLQTDTDNLGALATYRRHGFTPHHDYVTLRHVDGP